MSRRPCSIWLRLRSVRSAMQGTSRLPAVCAPSGCKQSSPRSREDSPMLCSLWTEPPNALAYHRATCRRCCTRPARPSLSACWSCACRKRADCLPAPAISTRMWGRLPMPAASTRSPIPIAVSAGGLVLHRRPHGEHCVPSLFELDLDHLIGLAAPWRRHFDDVLLALAEQRAGERRSDRDLALLHVGFDLADDPVFGLLVGILVDERDGGAEHHLVALELGGIDNLGAAELVLEVGHARLGDALLLLGGVVLGVLGEIAVGPGVGDQL